MKDDLISRQKAVNVILHYTLNPPYYMNEWAKKLIMAIKKDLMDGIEELPPTQQWIPFTKRELTAEEQEEHPEWCYIMDCPLPDDGQEILVSNGKWVWKDEFYVDDGCYLDSNHDLEGCAWMPLPEPYKEEKG